MPAAVVYYIFFSSVCFWLCFQSASTLLGTIAWRISKFFNHIQGPDSPQANSPDNRGSSVLTSLFLSILVEKILKPKAEMPDEAPSLVSVTTPSFRRFLQSPVSEGRHLSHHHHTLSPFHRWKCKGLIRRGHNLLCHLIVGLWQSSAENGTHIPTQIVSLYYRTISLILAYIWVII